MKQILLHARLFDGTQFHAGKAVILDGGKIEAIVDRPSSLGSFEIIDLTGLILAPGFIDCQVNGGGGVMLNGETSLSELEHMVQAHRAYGTTTMLPTLISDDWAAMEHVAQLIKDCHKHWGDGSSLAAVKGVHFEGPYLNIAKKGVHSADIIRPVDDEAVALLGHPDLGIRLVTLAPERVPPDFIAQLSSQGVMVCAGHSAGSYEDMVKALRQGLRGFTHLFNAMSPLNSREPGVVGAALADRESWCGLIVDGFHVHPASLKVAIASKPKGKMMLVTDAMASVGAADKSFTLYGTKITAKDGKCQTEDGTLAGSDLDMISAVRNCVELLDIPLPEALRMASLYPAQFLRIHHSHGVISEGFAADLVAFDPQSWSVSHSWINGFHASH